MQNLETVPPKMDPRCFSSIPPPRPPHRPDVLVDVGCACRRPGLALGWLPGLAYLKILQHVGSSSALLVQVGSFMFLSVAVGCASVPASRYAVCGSAACDSPIGIVSSRIGALRQPVILDRATLVFVAWMQTFNTLQAVLAQSHCQCRGSIAPRAKGSATVGSLGRASVQDCAEFEFEVLPPVRSQDLSGIPVQLRLTIQLPRIPMTWGQCSRHSAVLVGQPALCTEPASC